jgi:hypothetical protein
MATQDEKAYLYDRLNLAMELLTEIAEEIAKWETVKPVNKCAYCTYAEGTEFVASYMTDSGRITGDHHVCLPCFPMVEKSKRGIVAVKAEVAEGVCPNCEGGGKYFYSGGAIGVCYNCNGAGKVGENNG